MPDAKSGDKTLLSGFVVKSGECLAIVRKTGLDTEMGEAAALVHAASERDTQVTGSGRQPLRPAAGQSVPPRQLTSPSSLAQGVFESKIMDVTEVVICITLVVTAIILLVQIYARGKSTEDVLLMVLLLSPSAGHKGKAAAAVAQRSPPRVLWRCDRRCH